MWHSMLAMGAAQLRVEYSGILPDLFGEGQAAIVAGVVDADAYIAGH